MQPATSDDAPAPRLSLVVAAIAVMALDHLVPFGHLVLYPLTLLATWVHEMGHGVSALLVGGHFQELLIFSDASGLAMTAEPAGLRAALVSAGGLVGPPIAGAAILVLARGRRRAGLVLGVLTVAIALSLLIWVRSFAGWLALPPLAAVLG